MNHPDLELIRESYKRYAEMSFQINTELSFWDNFFKKCIEKFIENDPDPSRRVYEAGYYVYDIPHDNMQGWLERMNVEMEKSVLDLRDWYNDFFGRTVNLYIGKAYNEMELVLLEAIQKIYFPQITSYTRSKSYYNKINNSLTDFLKAHSLPTVRVNNIHIIEFLKFNNSEFTSFIKMPVRTNYVNNWEGFFEFVSILRNSVTHFRSVLTTDTINELKSKYQEFVDAFLIIEPFEKGYHIMTSKDKDNLWSLMNDLTANTVKFLTGNQDLLFLS